jgi:hypothetical protein
MSGMVRTYACVDEGYAGNRTHTHTVVAADNRASSAQLERAFFLPCSRIRARRLAPEETPEKDISSRSKKWKLQGCECWEALGDGLVVAAVAGVEG